MRGDALQGMGVALFIMFFMSASGVLADTATGSPGTVENNASLGTQAWSNPAYSMISDDINATVSLDDNEVSHFLVAKNFSFALPADAIIDGIVVNVERHVNSIGGGSIVRDAAVRVVLNDTILAADRATNTSWNTGEIIDSHGNASDFWGLNWTVADINSPGFGAAIAVTKANNLVSSRQARIDHISIVVHYHVPDITPPNITLNGGDVTVDYGSNYTDAGATATDDRDGNVTANMTVTGAVNTSALGGYTITYAVSDSSGNNASIVRNVTVADLSPPVITINGPNPFTMDAEKLYNDWGATAADAVQGDVSAAIVVVNNVATGQGGTYTVDYFANDSAGNNASASRTVTVVPDTEHGKGPTAFSYFARSKNPRSESAAEMLSPAASSAPAAQPAAQPSAAPEASETPAQLAAAASLVAAASLDAGVPSAGSRRDASITGAVAGVLRDANPAWLAVAGALVLGLLGVARVAGRKGNPDQERMNALRKWKL